MKPFIKWAGGKTQLVDRLMEKMPQSFNTYYEPFIGGGALFFAVSPKKAHINDYSKEVATAYRVIKEDPTELIKKLINMEFRHKENPHNFYYEMRDLDRKDFWSYVDKQTMAARFIYLNKTCYNGLYRLNKKGKFNTPFGKKEEVKLFDMENVMQIYNFLSRNNIKITNLDFEEAVKDAVAGDLIFFDPPYDPITETSFTSYSAEGFGKEDQIRLAKLAKDLKDRGCYVILTNHDTEFIRELYKDFKIEVVTVKRAINSNASNREGKEIIIY